jgi:hypothetical protein
MPQLSILSRRNGVTKILAAIVPIKGDLPCFQQQKALIKRFHLIEEKNVISLQLYQVTFG